MKRIYQLPLLFIALASSLTSCQLAEKPYSFITPSQFYNTASDAEAALTAAYTPITDLYSRVGTQVPDYSADQCFPRAVVGREQLTVFSYDATNDLIGQYWQHCYNGVNRANQVIENVPRVTMDEARKKQILAEAQFLRGLYYFHLVKTFGDVPLKQISTKDIASTETSKSKAEDVYAFLIKDLEQAVKDLPAQPKDRGEPPAEPLRAYWPRPISTRAITPKPPKMRSPYSSRIGIASCPMCWIFITHSKKMRLVLR
ncbi:RagB/SusD family nutrient uptake outer membrane protein [Spirosoma telluris]|uniref:RagB/SusD family nutrient uptake outer membrane protein n=1 Tax=Spirosoma telluris TaxID=2183553 RepID=UPI002FC320BF